MEKHDKINLGDSLTLMIQDVGVMQKLHTDNAPEMVGRKTPFFRWARKEGIKLTSIKPLRPDENYGETLVKRAQNHVRETHGTKECSIKVMVLHYWVQLRAIVSYGAKPVSK